MKSVLFWYKFKLALPRIGRTCILGVCVLELLFTDESFSSSIASEKIAILGGGVSSCMTALALTEQQDWQEKYDITIYQVGWKLGGKGASGRNAE